MDDITRRLTACFKTVFPDLSEQQIAAASQSSVAAWDSTSAIVLVNVIEDEFGIQMDFEVLADLDTFDRVHQYLTKQIPLS